MLILGIDPGERYNGFARIEIQPDHTIDIPWVPETLNKQQLLKRLSSMTDKDAQVVVVEDWVTRPNVARPGGFDFDRMGTARIIGALELLSEQLQLEFVLQQASVKPVAYGYINRKYQKGAKNMHHWDALAHAVYYAVSRQKAFPLGAKPPFQN